MATIAAIPHVKAWYQGQRTPEQMQDLVRSGDLTQLEYDELAGMPGREEPPMDRIAIVDPDGVAVNIVVVESRDDYDLEVPEGHTAEPVDEDVSGIGVGWIYVDGDWVQPPRQALISDVSSIQPDGDTVAEVVYIDTRPDAPEQVTFTANGATSVESLVDGEATIEIASNTPGDVIYVSVDALPGSVVTINVED